MLATKKVLFCATALYLMSGAAANAQLVIEPVINTAPAPVYAPAPFYTGPVISTYDPHHRRHDYEYWRAQHHGPDGHWHR